MSKPKVSASFVGSLKKVKTETPPPPAKDKGKEESGKPVPAVKPPRPAKHESELASLMDKVRNVSVTCELEDDIKAQIPVIQSAVSPFSTPLSLSKLVDLMYCEVQTSPQLRERMLAKGKGYTITITKKNRSSVNVPDYIVDFLQEAFGSRPQKAVTAFLTWIGRDWTYIQNKVRKNGLPKGVETAW